MSEPRSSSVPPEPGEAEVEKRPSGIPPESSTRRRSLRPPEKSESVETARPPGLKEMTPSARLRLELALDADDDAEPRPPGLVNMTTSARQRLELALDQDPDESIRPPAALPRSARAAMSMSSVTGRIRLDEESSRLVRSLSRWVAFCGLLTLTVGALTGLSYVTGPGSVAHVVVGILACAASVWLLAAAYSFHKVLGAGGNVHHLVNGMGLLRSAMLLKAILLFSAMVLGCFTFSIATGLLLLL